MGEIETKRTKRASKPPVAGFKECRSAWMEAYREATGIGYYFQAKDAGALGMLCRKIAATEDVAGASDEAERVAAVFAKMLADAPRWYRDAGFSLCVWNSKFNELVAEIRKKNGQNGRSGTGSAGNGIGRCGADNGAADLIASMRGVGVNG